MSDQNATTNTFSRFADERPAVLPDGDHEITLRTAAEIEAVRLAVKDYDTLLARLEKLDAPCREADCDYARSIGALGGYHRWNNAVLLQSPAPIVPRYTASIDAAVTAIPHGFSWAGGTLNENDEPWACITSNATHEDFTGTGCCVAIATAVAALRARIALLTTAPR